jgi:hypothetical protein
MILSYTKKAKFSINAPQIKKQPRLLILNPKPQIIKARPRGVETPRRFAAKKTEAC